jgi:hypothetical protein
LSKLGEAAKKIPLGESDHWIEVPEGCTRWFATTAEYAIMYHELPHAARFWLFLFGAERF